jgi:hypothetical protein
MCAGRRTALRAPASLPYPGRQWPVRVVRRRAESCGACRDRRGLSRFPGDPRDGGAGRPRCAVSRVWFRGYDGGVSTEDGSSRPDCPAPGRAHGPGAPGLARGARPRGVLTCPAATAGAARPPPGSACPPCVTYPPPPAPANTDS